MHPQIVRDGPGSCPICGMALEPDDAEPRRGARTRSSTDFRRRFWWTLPLVARRARARDVRATHAQRADATRILARARARRAGRAVGRLAVLRALGAVDREPQPEHVDADRHRRRRGLRLQRRRDRGAGHASQTRSASTAASRVYFEAAAIIVSLTLLGQLLELKARSEHVGRDSRRCSASRRRRRAASRTTAREEDIPLTHVHVGDRLRVRPGEKVPVDGVVRRGPLERRRVDADRRADSGREERPATSVIGATLERHRQHS